MLTAVTRTHPGKVRSNNEDMALWDFEISALAMTRLLAAITGIAVALPSRC